MRQVTEFYTLDGLIGVCEGPCSPPLEGKTLNYGSVDYVVHTVDHSIDLPSPGAPVYRTNVHLRPKPPKSL